MLLTGQKVAGLELAAQEKLERGNTVQLPAPETEVTPRFTEPVVNYRIRGVSTSGGVKKRKTRKDSGE